MSDILGLMSPEAAERLTVEMAPPRRRRQVGRGGGTPQDRRQDAAAKIAISIIRESGRRTLAIRSSIRLGVASSCSTSQCSARTPFLDPYHVGGHPCRGPSGTRKAAVDNDVVILRQNEAGLVAQAVGKGCG